MQRLDRAYLALFREAPVLIPLAFVAGASQLAFALLNVYALPIYLAQHWGLSGKVIGTASATFLFCETLLKLPMGRLSDRIGRRALIVLGPLLIALNPAVIAALPVRLWRLVFVLRAADGVGAAAVWPPLYALVGDLTTRERRTAAMSVVNTVYLGAIGAAAVVGSLISYLAGDDRAPLYAATGLLLASAIVGQAALPRTRRISAAAQVVADRREAAPGLRGQLALVLFLTFLMTMGVLTTASFLVLYLRHDLHLTSLQVGRLLMVLGIPVLVFGLPLGHLAGRIGTSRAVRVSLVFSSLLMWLLPLCQSLLSFTALAIPLILGQVLAMPAWLALAATLAPTSRRGGVMGAVATAEGAGAVVGPLLGGLLWDMAHRFIFYGAAAVLSLAALIALLSLREDRIPASERSPEEVAAPAP